MGGGYDRRVRAARMLPITLLLVAVSSVPAGNAATTGDAAPLTPYAVIRTFPHDPGAFTQGLEFHKGRLFETTGQDPASLRRVRLRTGVVQQQVRLNQDRHFGEGLTFKNGRIWWITWQSEKGFWYDPVTFERLGSFRYGGEGWGLTHNDRRIIMSNGSDEIAFRHPETFEVRRRLQVTDQGSPVTDLNELEWVRGRLFANVFMQDVIAVIDPKSGRVLEWIDLGNLRANEPASAGALNGIALVRSEGRLFVTGKNWSHLYEIEPAD